MKAALAAGSLAAVVSVMLLSPSDGPGALVLCALLSVVVLAFIRGAGEDRQFLTQLFAAALLLRLFVGLLINNFNLQHFFGGDAHTYDLLGILMVQVWYGDLQWHQFQGLMGVFLSRNSGMIYVVSVIYVALGRNMLAVQFFSAVLGAATAPLIFLCARHIFQNMRVARVAGYAVALFPSMVLWSSQGLKDGPLVFLLALSVLTTLRLARKFDTRYLALLVASLFGIFTLRFYIFYMMVASIVGAFALGLGPVSAKGLVRQFVVVVAVGLALTQLGVLRSAETQFEVYGNLEAIQRSRADLAKSADSGFGKDVDVSTASGALTAIPVGMIYLLFAPFPWQLASLRQLITLPEMVVWWASFPLLVTGLWFTLKHRMRQALPILIFTTMLTLAYSVFQGNVGTAYRQRSQLLIFYFIFAAVGYQLVKERRENRQQAQARVAGAQQAATAALVPARRAAFVPARQAGFVPARQSPAGLLARAAHDPSKLRAVEEFRASVRECFMTHPATTGADFERCWPKLRDELFKEHTRRALAALPAPALVSPGGGNGNGHGNGHGNGGHQRGGFRGLPSADRT